LKTKISHEFARINLLIIRVHSWLKKTSKNLKNKVFNRLRDIFTKRSEYFFGECRSGVHWKMKVRIFPARLLFLTGGNSRQTLVAKNKIKSEALPAPRLL